MEERYSRNVPAISAEEQAALAEKRVLIAGCGGLGGNLLEHLARLGVGHITAVDGDVFEASNLNRQILSTPALLGSGKAAAARQRAGQVNPAVSVTAAAEFLTEENADRLLAGCDLALDALDNAPARLCLAEACARLGIPLVHGAVQGWSDQAAVVTPGSGLLHRLYAGAAPAKYKTVLPFTAAFCAAVQASEAVKLLCGRPSALENRLLLADLLHMDWEILTI